MLFFPRCGRVATLIVHLMVVVPCSLNVLLEFAGPLVPRTWKIQLRCQPFSPIFWMSQVFTVEVFVAVAGAEFRYRPEV